MDVWRQYLFNFRIVCLLAWWVDGWIDGWIDVGVDRWAGE